MKSKVVFLIILFISIGINGQNLHSDSNAASFENEANTTTGWASTGTLTSDATDSQNGLFSLRLEMPTTASREASYPFTAIVGEQYTITIWAKRGVQSTNPAFAVWTGLQGFSTTQITSTAWTQYTWQVTADRTNCIIRAYAGKSSGSVGDHIFLDNVSIVPATPGDTEAPSAVSDLAASNTTMTSTDLSWTASTDNVAVTDYEVFQDGVSIGFTGGATTFNVAGLTASTSYAFTVFARDAVPNISAVSNMASVTTLAPDTQAPSAVVDLSASDIFSTGVNLSWSEPFDNVGVVDYEVFLGFTSIGFTGGATSTNSMPPFLYPSWNYAFTVVAIDAAGNRSAESNVLIATTLPNTAIPPDPTPMVVPIQGLSASNVTETTMDLTWSQYPEPLLIAGFEVLQDGVRIGLIDDGATSFNVAGLSASTTYAFQIAAVDALGNTITDGLGDTSGDTTSAILNVSTSAAPDTEAPSAVTDLAASNTTMSSTDLSWTASTDNVAVTDYEVFQDGVSIGFTGGATTMNVTGLTASTSYAFTVFARDAIPNISAVSNTANVTTASDTQAPSAVIDLAGSGTTDTTTNLAWTASTDNVAVTDYEVFQDGVSIGFTGGITTTNVTGLTAGTSYAFTVFARDAVPNISAVSNTASVTTSAGPDTEAPSAVTDLAGTNTTSTSTSLAWTASTDNVAVTDYEVFQDGVSIGFTGGTTTMNVTGLTASASYAFTVFARDAVPNISTVSNTANVTTSAGGGIINYTSENANLNTIDWNTRDLFADRNVGIGTTNTQGYRLAVAGNVVAEEIKVALQANWPDYVFKNNYNLPTLQEVEAYINKYGHLINIPSAKEVEKSGIRLGDMNSKLLRKIEELTLYTIEQEKKIEKLEDENETIKILLEKVLQLEKQLKAKK